MLRKPKIYSIVTWGLLLVPPTLTAVASIVAAVSVGGTNNIWLAKGLIYVSFISILGALGLATLFFYRGKITRALLTGCVVVCGIYATLPISIAINKVSTDQPTYEHNLKYKKKVSIRTLLFPEPHYSMPQKDTNNLLGVINKLEMGDHYTNVLKLLPPVPEDCPIIMKTLSTKEIVLIYFIRKRTDGTEISSDDKHITLRFNSQENLIRIEKAI